MVKDVTTGGMRRREGLRPVMASAAVLALVLAQLPAPVGAGPFDPGLGRRAERGLQEGPYGRAAVAAGLSVTLPFQTVRGRSALAETRLAAGLALWRTARLATSAAAFEPVRVRPLARLSVELAGRPDSLRLNGLPLLVPDALAAGEDATEPANAPRKKHKNRKWWWIGGGVLVAGFVTALAVASSNLPGDLGFDQQQ